MNKFTDTEIIGTLELIASEQNRNFLRIVLDLIKRLKAENDELQRKIVSCNSETERFKAEHKDFVKKLGDLHAMELMIFDRKDKIKANAIKEFAERLKEKVYSQVVRNKIDYTLDEMTGQSWEKDGNKFQ